MAISLIARRVITARMEHKSIKKQEVKLIRELAYLEKEIEKQIDYVLDMRTHLLRDQHDLEANVVVHYPRKQNQEEYFRKRKSYQHHRRFIVCSIPR